MEKILTENSNKINSNSFLDMAKALKFLFLIATALLGVVRHIAIQFFFLLYLAGMANNDNTNQTFQNLKDYKLEIDYNLKDSDRHHFRLAYDYIENFYDGRDNTFNNLFGPIVSTAMNSPVVDYAIDVKSNILTFTYTYRLSDNTRLKLCYQNLKLEAKELPNQCVDLYFAELYSGF